MFLVHHCPCHLQHVSILSFGYSVLLRCVSTSKLPPDSFLLKVCGKGVGEVLFAAVQLKTSYMTIGFLFYFVLEFLEGIIHGRSCPLVFQFPVRTTHDHSRPLVFQSPLTPTPRFRKGGRKGEDNVTNMITSRSFCTKIGLCMELHVPPTNMYKYL